MSGINNYVLDTNIILYLMNGDTTLAGILDYKIPIISYITEMELLSFRGISTIEEKKIKALLEETTIIEMNPAIKQAAIRIKKESGLKLPDSIIAATADFLGLPLLTADADFNKLKSLSILQYKK